MATEPTIIDLDDDAALALALAEVERTRQPRQLRRDGRVIAVLNVPLAPIEKEAAQGDVDAEQDNGPFFIRACVQRVRRRGRLGHERETVSE